MKTKDDFKPDAPESLKEIVLGELWQEAFQCEKEGREPPELPDGGIDKLMQAVYTNIEKESLATYHSNEPWALRQWALSNILKEEVVNEATTEMVHGLISPIIEWQAESYDPVSKYKQKLIADGKPEHSITVCLMSVVRFVSRKGRKRSYSDDEIIEHISHLRKDGYIKKMVNWETREVTWKRVSYKPTTLYNEAVQLKQFFQFLHGRNWVMPIKMPDVPDREEMYQPMLSDKEIESLIFTTIIDDIPADWIVRLAASTLYGYRVSELGDIEVHLNGESSSIYIRTRKKGIRKPQPIPKSLLPIFAVPIKPMKEWRLSYILKSICKKAEIMLPERAGWHALRRRVVTDIYEKTDAKEIPIINYFRWSTKQRHLSQLPTYVKTKVEASDREIILQHPILKMWEKIIPYIIQWHPEYKNNPRARQLYNEMI